MNCPGKAVWLPALLVLTVSIAWQPGNSVARSAPSASSRVPAVTQLPDARVAPRAPTPTQTIEPEPVLTAVGDTIGTPEPSPVLPTLPTETPSTPTPAVALGATFEDADGFFSLECPGDWVVSPRGGALLAPTGGGGLSMSIEIKAVTPEALADRYADSYATKVDNYLEMGRTQSDLDGHPAVWIEQSFTSDDAPYKGFLAATVRNRVGFVFIGWSPTERYALLQPILHAMTRSVRITEFAESPPYAEWLIFRTSHFVFHYVPDTWISGGIKGIAVEHEEAFDDNVAYLEVDYAGPIDVYLYASEESLYRATAREAGFAINEAGEVHARWLSEDDHQTPGHEITHVIMSNAIGEPSEALLGEGVAVWLDHGGNDYDQMCAELRAENRLVRLDDLLGEGWDGSAAAYYESGSFVGFLLDSYGVDRFQEVYTMLDFLPALKKVYRANLAALERKWLNTLD